MIIQLTKGADFVSLYIVPKTKAQKCNLSPLYFVVGIKGEKLQTSCQKHE